MKNGVSAMSLLVVLAIGIAFSTDWGSDPSIIYANEQVPSYKSLTSATSYSASLLRVVDGDTYDLEIKIWEDITLTKRIRLLGVDTPELRPRKGTDEEKELERTRARQATAFVVEKLKGDLRFCYSWKSDSFGRALGTVIFLEEGLPTDICESLLKNGHAKLWK